MQHTGPMPRPLALPPVRGGKQGGAENPPVAGRNLPRREGGLVPGEFEIKIQSVRRLSMGARSDQASEVPRAAVAEGLADVLRRDALVQQLDDGVARLGDDGLADLR
eukprot:gene6365-biopygen12233